MEKTKFDGDLKKMLTESPIYQMDIFKVDTMPDLKNQFFLSKFIKTNYHK